MKTRTYLLFVLAVAASALSTGCAGQCPQVKSGYEKALAQETELEQEVPQDLEAREDAVHLGFAMKTDLLNDIIGRVLATALDEGLDVVSEISVQSGTNIAVNTQGDVVNLKVEASDACDNCFKITGGLDGKLGVKIPVLGEQSADLDGSLTLVAPITLTRLDDGRGAVQLDLTQVAKVGRSQIVPRISGIPDTWSRALQSPLSDKLLESLTQNLDPVTLVRYDPPDLGIPGLEVVPVQLATNAETGTVFTGFTTNVKALADSGKTIEPITDLGDDENIALAFQPDMVMHAVSLMMQKDSIPRTYSSDGEPLRAGPAHVTLRGFDFSKGRVGELPMKLGFKVWNMQDGGPCYWFDGLAEGRVALRGENLEVSLTNVSVTDGSLPVNLVKATDWMNAEFLQGGKKVIRTSLSDQNLEIPGGKMNFIGMGLEMRNNAIILRGNSGVADDQS
ncbi:MAG: hypothetical protein ACQEVA_02875 [Myxococcota bacterium]